MKPLSGGDQKSDKGSEATSLSRLQEIAEKWTNKIAQGECSTRHAVTRAMQEATTLERERLESKWNTSSQFCRAAVVSYERELQQLRQQLKQSQETVDRLERQIDEREN